MDMVDDVLDAATDAAEAPEGTEPTPDAGDPLPRILAMPGGRPHLYRPLAEAAVKAAEKGEPLKLRQSVTYFDPITREHVYLPRMAWILQFDGAESAEAFLKAEATWVEGWVAAQAGGVDGVR